MRKNEDEDQVINNLSLYRFQVDRAAYIKNMDNSVGNFFCNFVPDNTSSLSSPQYDNRLTKNSKLVQKFLEKSQEKNSALYSGKENVNKLNTSNSSQSEIEIQEALAYLSYDKLWASSKHHRSLLLAQWECLVEKVKQQEPEFTTFKLASSDVSGILFLCRRLNTNFVVRFRALELYNRYLKDFARKHHDFLKKGKKKEILEFKTRFQSQVFLRMCTCILIASKLQSDTQIRALTTEKIRELLAAEGFEYSRSDIARSEMRVLETVNYKCLWVTPLELVEQLLSILDLELDFLKRAHYYCVLLLEYCYSDLDNIRDKFFLKTKNSRRFTVSNGKITVHLKCAAIVAAALFIVSTETRTELHKIVAKTANLNEEDVHVLAIILLDSLNVS